MTYIIIIIQGGKLLIIKKYVLLEYPLSKINSIQEKEAIVRILKMLGDMLNQHEISPINPNFLS